MKLESRKLLVDAVEAGHAVAENIAGRTFTDYRNTRALRRAVEREFEIIGKALNRLGDQDPATAEQIPELRRAVDFRNRIIHGYDTVDDEAVWDIAQVHLPALVKRLGELLHQPPPPKTTN